MHSRLKTLIGDPMYKKLKTTLFAATVSSVLSSMAFGETPTLPTIQGLPNFDHNAAISNQSNNTFSISKKYGNGQNITASLNTKKSTNINKQYSKLSDQRDHFDNILNKSTFSWAKGQQNKASKFYSVLSRDSAIEKVSLDYVSQMGQKHGVSANAFAESELKFVSDNKRGAIISKYQQKANGIEVYGREFNVLMDQRFALVATSGYFSDAKLPQQPKKNQFKLSAEEAISKAFTDIGGDSIQLNKTGEKADYLIFMASSDSFSFSAEPRVKRVYYPAQKMLIPAYYVELMVAKVGTNEQIAYSHVISAVDGAILNRNNMVQNDSFTYKVFADNTAPYAPFDSPMGNDMTPHSTGVYDDIIIETLAIMNDVTIENVGISTNDPWLVDFATTTSGNNVDAYADLFLPDGFSEGDVRAVTTSDNTFDYAYDVNDIINSESNLNASIVNLFYVNNYLHDIYYDHGFDESAGVAQIDNFGRGGIDGDPLHVEAQDSSGMNNANMATPADGGSPRMQMFLWEDDAIRDGTVDNAIIAHEWGHYISSRLTNRGMYANNQGASMGEGWGDFFALMFMLRESDQTLPGNDQWQASYNDGGYAVNNGLVTHAYFFGLRRFPYTTNMENNALTFKHIEDGVALPTTMPIINLQNYDFFLDGLLNSEVHNSGEIWALMLWESYAGLLNREELDYSEAQSRMMDYMVASMKFTPVAPTFTEARDALLAVALANDVEDYNVIRVAFAKRGMGILAVSPDRFATGFDYPNLGHAGVVESFETEASVVSLTNMTLDTHNNTVVGAYCDIDDVLDVGETAMIKVSLKNVGTNPLSGITALVSSSSDITVTNNGVIDFSDMANWQDTTTGMVEVRLNNAAIHEQIELVITFNSEDATLMLPETITTSIWVNRDMVPNRAIEDFESPDITWFDWSRSNVLDNGNDLEHFINQWEVYDDVDFGSVAFGPNLSSNNDISMISPIVTVAETGEFSMSFEHYYDFEFGDANNVDDTTPWDGGVIEISIDGGEWTDVVAAGGVFDVGYNGTIGSYNPVLSERDGFVGLIASFWIDGESITFPEGELNGKDVQLRFRIGTDGAVAAWGWNIDNISFTNITTATPFSTPGADSGVCVNRTPHVLEATGPESVMETHTVSLTATSMDHDGSDLSYRWTQTAGTTAVDVTSTAATLNFTAPLVAADEVYSFSVAVTDGELTSEDKPVSLIIIANAEPVVTVEQTTITMKEKETVTLVVSGTDAEGDNLTYRWMLGDRLFSNSKTFQYTALDVREDTQVFFSVTAFDGIESSEAVQVIITVKNRSGGGSMWLFTLLLAPLVFIRRRIKVKQEQ